MTWPILNYMSNVSLCADRHIQRHWIYETLTLDIWHIWDILYVPISHVSFLYVPLVGLFCLYSRSLYVSISHVSFLYVPHPTGRWPWAMSTVRWKRRERERERANARARKWERERASERASEREAEGGREGRKEFVKSERTLISLLLSHLEHVHAVHGPDNEHREVKDNHQRRKCLPKFLKSPRIRVL